MRDIEHLPGNLQTLIERHELGNFFFLIPFHGPEGLQFIHTVKAEAPQMGMVQVSAVLQSCLKFMMEVHGLSLPAARGALLELAAEASHDIEDQIHEHMENRPSAAEA